MNILSNDLNRFDEFFRLWALVMAPVQVAISVYIMWMHLGISCLGGIAILLFFVPFQALMGQLFGKFRNKTSNLTDTRVKLMSELINAMKLIKVYCWETPFADLVQSVRK